MNKSKIINFITTMSTVSKVKLWLPVFFTSAFSISLIFDCINEANNFVEIGNLIVFRLMFICFMWLIYFSNKKIKKFNDFVMNNNERTSDLFDENEESVFQKKSNGVGNCVITLFAFSIVIEIFRILQNSFTISVTLNIIIYLILLILEIAFFMLAVVKWNQRLFYLDTITTNENNY